MVIRGEMIQRGTTYSWYYTKLAYGPNVHHTRRFKAISRSHAIEKACQWFRGAYPEKVLRYVSCPEGVPVSEAKRRKAIQVQQDRKLMCRQEKLMRVMPLHDKAGNVTVPPRAYL